MLSPNGATQLASHAELSGFLVATERRAYKHALYAVRDEHAALDIVQDAMLKLAEKYPDKPVEELPMLFHRILQNTIHDHFRRQKVRGLWTTLLSALSPRHDNEDEHDPLETLLDETKQHDAPETSLEQAQTLSAIEAALKDLPARQREAFLLRYWEEMDISETAAIMGCSEGSVKTHCSRATHALAECLKAQGVTLP